MSVTAAHGISYKGHHLRVEVRRRDNAYVADLDISFDATGVTYRRWWPVVQAGVPQGHATAAEAEAAALQFGYATVDAQDRGPLWR